MAPTPVFVALLAGGRGTRFWPLSRHRLPKQLLDVTGEGPMLRLTRDRVAALCPQRNVLVVTTEDLAGASARLLRLPARNVIGEPAGRNTGPAVGLAALIAATRDPDAVVLALPADHHVSREAQLRTLLRRGIRAARAHRGIVIFGIVPDRPETGYGYLNLGAESPVPGVPGLRRVERFREKPDAAGARRLIAEGALWNSGMFCFHAAGCLDEIRRAVPDLAEGLDALRPHVDRPSFRHALHRIHPRLPAVSFDHGVLESSGRVDALAADVGWSDVGSWESLAALLPGDASGNRARGRVLLHDAERCLVIQDDGAATKRTVVLLGTRDLVVVETGDVVFACPKDQERDVKALMARLARERPDLA